MATHRITKRATSFLSPVFILTKMERQFTFFALPYQSRIIHWMPANHNQRPIRLKRFRITIRSSFCESCSWILDQQSKVKSSTFVFTRVLDSEHVSWTQFSLCFIKAHMAQIKALPALVHQQLPILIKCVYILSLRISPIVYILEIWTDQDRPSLFSRPVLYYFDRY